jgi:hypothetical protein
MTITPTTRPDRPASPWTGSRHETRHRWQLDGVRTLDEAIELLRALADELEAAHAAGWWLTEPVRNGHLLAQRASRRRRAAGPAPGSPGPAAPTDSDRSAAPVLPPWRARVVDEPPQPGDAVLDLSHAGATPVVAVVQGGFEQQAGPALPGPTLDGLALQEVTGLGGRRWGVALARVGPTADLVADGSALRVHAVEDGVLVRTVESLTFLHGADRAATLPSAAAAYRRLASAAEAMLGVGGRLADVDDGFLHVAYDRA